MKIIYKIYHLLKNQLIWLNQVLLNLIEYVLKSN